MSDVPLGAMLSGGLDSSLITALMARNMTEPVNTFSVGFAEAGQSNELGDAREVAALLGCEHHELELSIEEQVIDPAELVWHLDEPLADLSALGFIALSGLAARHVTVALSGQGADELLAGYGRYRTAALAEQWARFPAALRRIATTCAKAAPAHVRQAIETLDQGRSAEDIFARQRRLDRATDARLPLDLLARHRGTARRLAGERLAGIDAPPLAGMLYLDGRLGLVDDMLHYFDRASMAHSLEVRVPFLDHHLVEFAATIPTSFKVRKREPKAILKHAARGLVPDRIIDKRKIGFFNPAVGAWLKAQASGAVSDYLLAPTPRYAELLDRRRVERMVAGQAAGDRGPDGLVLAVLMLEIWLSSYLPRAMGQPVAPQEQIRLSA
jgi:asparagine synthase (glutamine-hydrolysing)